MPDLNHLSPNQQLLLQLDDRKLGLILASLKDFDAYEFSLKTLTSAEKLDIQKLIQMAEWSSLHRFYNNIIYKLYKQFLEDDDIKTGKRMIMFISAIRQRPLSLYQNSSYENITGQTSGNEGSKIVEHGFYSGGNDTGTEQGGVNVSGVNERHGEII
jgi:hypothetical protein